jgi:hypothetical protein
MVVRDRMNVSAHGTLMAAAISTNSASSNPARASGRRGTIRGSFMKTMYSLLG